MDHTCTYIWYPCVCSTIVLHSLFYVYLHLRREKVLEESALDIRSVTEKVLDLFALESRHATQKV